MSFLCFHPGRLAARVVERRNVRLLAATFATAAAANPPTRKLRSVAVTRTSAVSAVHKGRKRRAYASAAAAFATERPSSYSSSSPSSSSARIPYPKQRLRADGEAFSEHLNALFPPLTFPPDVAAQMLTHISASEAWAGHCARLGFLGRRVLLSYLLLFLHDASAQIAPSSGNNGHPPPSFDFDHIAYRALFTPLLGEHVGNQWNIGRIMLWRAPVPGELRAADEDDVDDGYGHGERLRDRVASMKSPGLYKVQGTIVEAIMGGIFHQHGGTVALRVFHTRVLPHLLLPGSSLGLNDAFHGMARKYLADMGGPDAPLVVNGKSSNYPRIV